MDVEAVMNEIGAKLEAIKPLRVKPFWADSVSPPAAIVGLPDEVEFDKTYGRGVDAMTVPVWVLVARASDRAASNDVAAFLSGQGSKSVKAALDSSDTNPYQSCDTVTVTRGESGAYTSAGVELFGAEFQVDITGQGSGA